MKGVDNMPRRGESIYHRKDGRWEARYVKGITFDNKKLYGSVYGKSYKEVKEKRRTICMQLENNSYIICKETTGFYARQWLKVNRIRFKPATYEKYLNIVNNYILPSFDYFKIKDLTTTHINVFSNQLLKQGKSGKPLSPKTVKDILLILKAIISFIESEYNINVNIKIVYPTNPKQEANILNEQDFLALNRVLINEMDLCKFGVLVAMATGIRIGEVCSLKWENIDLDNRYMIIEKTMQRIKNFDKDGPKTRVIEVSPKSDNSKRMIPIPHNLIPIFKRFKANDNCYILSGDCKKIVEPRQMDRKFKSYVQEAGIERANFHMLRHTFATLCIENGFEVKSLSEILGHSSSKITLDRYVHSSFNTKQKYLDRFSNKFIGI